MRDLIVAALQEARTGLDALLADDRTLEAVGRAAEAMVACFQAGGKVVACGNGGSMSDAMHLCEELTARYRDDRPALPAVAVSDPAHLTCVANDYGFEYVFSRYVEAHGREGDVLVAISTSGRSPNVLRAAEAARARGMRVVALTGAPSCPLEDLADVHVPTPAGRYADRVQELHIKVVHVWIELVEASLFSNR